jgi:hypothetical protein
MASVAGNAQNIIYTAGLRVTDLGIIDQSPIDGSVNVDNGTITVTRNWIGYFLSPTTGSVNLGVQVTAYRGDFAETIGRVWLGTNAIAGIDAQADVTAAVSFGTISQSSNFNLVAGVYYPVRIRWNGGYTGDNSFFGSGSAGGSIIFLLGGSNNVSGRIFYNSLTNGF